MLNVFFTMIRAKGLVPVMLIVFAAVSLRASGPVGIYGIVERVVFEPDERAPERIQVWGAFAYADGAGGGLTISPVKRGYLYFKLRFPSEGTNKVAPAAELAEWNDLKAVAGTGQAIAFGRWLYSGPFASLQPDSPSNLPPHIFDGGSMTDMRVRSETETPAAPATYQTNSGIVKLPEQGTYGDLVKQLRAALKR